MDEPANSPVPRRVPQPAPRASDADRETTAEVLRAAAADGRLDLSELDERLGATYAAKTYPELEQITADLTPAPLRRPNRTEPLRLRTKSGSIKRTGQWVVPASIVAEATSGTIKLDFTEAVCPHLDVRVQARTTSGTVVLIVPPGWSVTSDDTTSTSGSIVNRVGVSGEPGRPQITITGGVRSGTIKARHPRTGFWRKLFGA